MLSQNIPFLCICQDFFNDSFILITVEHEMDFFFDLVVYFSILLYT